VRLLQHCTFRNEEYWCRRTLILRVQVADGDMAILEGLVFHRRAEQSINEFTYRVQYTLVSLDKPPKGFVGDHISADQARAQAGTGGPVYLLTTPTSAGYTQNPISVYYCYDDSKEARLARCIAEVSNPHPSPSPSSLTLIPHPSSLIPHPSSLIPHPSSLTITITITITIPES